MSKIKSAKSSTRKPVIVIDTTSPQYSNLRQAIHACWQAIGYDALSAAEQEGESITNQDAIEVCLDANYMTMYPGGVKGKEADEYVTHICNNVGGYEALMDVLCRDVHLT